MSANAQPTGQTKADEPKKTVPQLGALEEDDEFEEFQAEEWIEETNDSQFWQSNWDDDDTEDDFLKQLRAQLESVK